MSVLSQNQINQHSPVLHPVTRKHLPDIPYVQPAESVDCGTTIIHSAFENADVHMAPPSDGTALTPPADVSTEKKDVLESFREALRDTIINMSLVTSLDELRNRISGNITFSKRKIVQLIVLGIRFLLSAFTIIISAEKLNRTYSSNEMQLVVKVVCYFELALFCTIAGGGLFLMAVNSIYFRFCKHCDPDLVSWGTAQDMVISSWALGNSVGFSLIRYLPSVSNATTLYVKYSQLTKVSNDSWKIMANKFSHNRNQPKT